MSEKISAQLIIINFFRTYHTDMYVEVLVAAAECLLPEFRAADLRKNELYARDITQQSLNSYCQLLVCDGESRVPVYKFNEHRRSLVQGWPTKNLAYIVLKPNSGQRSSHPLHPSHPLDRQVFFMLN
jgi:hypothetical protein